MHAMIVAINNYPNMPLRGCVADGRAMVDFVKTKLHVPESQIVTLFDEAASREAILSTFKTHFTDNDAVAKGDGIVFFYAGHGTQEDAPDDWGLDGEIPVECICPQDLNWETVHAIPSTTLNALFRELAYAKGDNIVSLLSVTRSSSMCCLCTRVLDPDCNLRLLSLRPDHAHRAGTKVHASASRFKPKATIRPRCRRPQVVAGPLWAQICQECLTHQLPLRHYAVPRAPQCVPRQ